MSNELVPVKPIKRRRRQPTPRQIKAIQYINMGYSKRQAMIKAGYTPKVAEDPANNLLRKVSVKNFINGMAGELVDAGLTKEYMIGKFKEWLEAQKVIGARVVVKKESPTPSTDLKPANSMTNDFVEVPDYETQLKAFDKWKKIMDDQGNPQGGGQMKRKLTIEEFISDGSSQR